MCKAACQEGFLSGQEELCVFHNQRTMDAKHIAVGWSTTPWTHMWIEHMHVYVAKSVPHSQAPTRIGPHCHCAFPLAPLAQPQYLR